MPQITYPRTASRNLIASQPNNQENKYSDQICHEFQVGSGIAPSLYLASVEVVSDTVMLPGGEVSYPIHDALNWRVTRFGHQARASQEAALILNEDGSCWQAKLAQPRQDTKKGKPIKYETPAGAGSLPYQPPVPAEIRARISERYGIEVPKSGSFWDWVAEHPEIEIIWTEGAKKALSLLSQGYVAIALYGVNGGYRKLLDGSRSLIPAIERFCQPERSHLIAFDQDEQLETRRKVAVAIARFGALLGGTVALIRWDFSLGKGVDDLLVRDDGIDRFEAAYCEQIELSHWRIEQRLRYQLTLPVHLRLRTRDLSELELSEIPEAGIIAISSAKGTGKTKFIANTTKDSERALVATHRIALGRNICARLGLNWRGDLDKVKGEFITGSGYTLRVGFCVDSLLSINPETFKNCDLIIDEVVQVVRHLLTSDTCSKQGKRPALLARFHELIRVARRVIVADADLDNATLLYLQELRDSDSNIFLIRNDYTPDGYHVRFIDAPDRTAIVDDLLGAVSRLESGKVIVIATDSKTVSKHLVGVIAHHASHRRVLVINSETSSGELERAFVQAPDTELLTDNYDVVVCSPSMATGVSIEAQGKVVQVYGIFTGASSTDADMAQALGRVREPVERIVWCATTGNNYAKVGRDTHSSKIIQALKEKTAVTLKLLRDSLTEDTSKEADSYDWQNPHLRLYADISSRQNLCMGQLRNSLLVRLRLEGNQVTLEQKEKEDSIAQLFKEVRQAQQQADAERLVAAENLSPAEIALLEQQESISPAQQMAISKYYIKDFYVLDELTVDDVLLDNGGRKRGEILALEAQKYPDLSLDRAIRQLEKQASWKRGICPWDITHIELSRLIRHKIGLDELITQIEAGLEWSKYDIAPYAQRARELAPQIKVGLHFSIHDEISDVQIIHQLLGQIGIKVRQTRWCRSVIAHEGEKLRLYSLDNEHYAAVAEVLERRQQKREGYLPPVGSPHRINNDLKTEGDPTIESYAELVQEAFSYGLEAVTALLSHWKKETILAVATFLQNISPNLTNTIERLSLEICPL